MRESFRNLKRTLLTSVLFTLCASGAMADNLTLVCSVKNVLASTTNDNLVGLELLCTPNAQASNAGSGPDNVARVWAPVSSVTSLLKMKEMGQTASFTMTRAYFGTLTAINGQVIALAKSAVSDHFSVVTANAGTSTYTQVKFLLNQAGTPFAQRFSCTKEGNACRQVQDRQVVLKFATGKLSSLTLAENGGGWLRHEWVEGFVRVAVEGKFDAGSTTVTTLDAATSAQVRSTFHFGQKAVFDRASNPFTPHFSGLRLTFSDNGLVIQIKSEAI